MLPGARLGKEIVVTVVNKIGVLADISQLLADHGINIIAVLGYAAGNNEAKITLVTEDNLRASEALRKKNYTSIKESEVVIVELENKAGALKNVTAKLAAGNIDIKYIYGTTCACGGPSMIVFSTSDNEKALMAFKSK